MTKKSNLIQVKVNEQEEEIIVAKAKKLGLTVSAYLRFVALNAEISVNVDLSKTIK